MLSVIYMAKAPLHSARCRLPSTSTQAGPILTSDSPPVSPDDFGDYGALNFVVMPSKEGDFNAKQVFETLKFLTLCEEKGPDNQAVSQHLRSTPSGSQMT
ncbi:hypothetical protein PHYPSEUDO_008891 [Phytophthora pseudosyringae]|uniref:Uncharacterized protein n=1 Tax=Phytophthora pseudosyringae TaxID=221518 RepID=A0A8T1VIF2_9STRA|nr:hypothetical protein PHYPSEUDO_008891 [Phytophthora pseudosyringae]